MLENVSRETICRLKRYQALLGTWQKKLNLVSSSTLSQAWERHFLDSTQLLSYLPSFPISLIDLGSGAGFPGLVLAILRPDDLSVTLVESDFKKCLFLENVSRETKTSIKILRSRIESVKDVTQANVITARGLAPLSKLFDYASPLMGKDSICLFLKGKDAEKEIDEAQQKWDFRLEIYSSLTDAKGKVLKIQYLKEK